MGIAMHQLGTLPSRKMSLLLQQWTLIMAIMAVSLGSAAAQETGRAIAFVVPYSLGTGPAVCKMHSIVPALTSGRFLKEGAKPSELLIQQSSKVDFVINLRAAKALGVEVPPALLARADEVIE